MAVSKYVGSKTPKDGAYNCDQLQQRHFDHALMNTNASRWVGQSKIDGWVNVHDFTPANNGQRYSRKEEPKWTAIGDQRQWVCVREVLHSQVKWGGGSDTLSRIQADLNGPHSPSGYQCLPSDTVPIINGGDLSAGLVEIEEHGSLPLHRHSANEILFVLEGIVNVGILTPEKSYLNTLRAREFVYLPQGLSHFLINPGSGKVVAFSAFNSANPPYNFDHQEKYASDVPSSILSQVSFLNEPQVRKLKARFNGTG
ncbi:hypothetical protein V8G54_002621 [Vigna mungo]|uniref:Cupin type-1 domain-containing protein n=1 Tax=Vigna mungo TaxID=3915 RepID=A0AAQ3SAZ5_VIGMU